MELPARPILPLAMGVTLALPVGEGVPVVAALGAALSDAAADALEVAVAKEEALTALPVGPALAVAASIGVPVADSEVGGEGLEEPVERDEAVEVGVSQELPVGVAVPLGVLDPWEDCDALELNDCMELSTDEALEEGDWYCEELSRREGVPGAVAELLLVPSKEEEEVGEARALEEEEGDAVALTLLSLAVAQGLREEPCEVRGEGVALSSMGEEGVGSLGEEEGTSLQLAAL